MVSWVCMSCLMLWLTGCDCEPESDEQLCGDDSCGQLSLLDNCGDQRQVDCGDCPQGLECDDNQCVCEGETTQVLCERLDAQCGVHGLTDECGHERKIECGSCTEPDQCVAGTCDCLPERDDLLCESHDMTCGQATIEDRCGGERQVNCGDCLEPYACEDNRCLCDGETEDELCEAQSLECGQATVVDSCDEEVQLGCGSCPDHHECEDNLCECVGETDEELCDEVDGACDTIETTDACGETRTVDCEPCVSGDSTFGAVRDASSGALLDDATIHVYSWPPPGGSNFSWFWESGFRSNDPDISTTTSSTSGDINYEFASQESMCTDDQVATLSAHQWYRYVVERSGYEPGVFYRLHPGHSAGDCASECAAADDARCHRQDFELWPADEAYPQTPNLITDPRELEDNQWQCALLPPDAPVDELIGFRVRLGGVNIGHGPFHLEAIPDGGGQVLQHIEWSDGSVESRTIPSGTFEFFDDHDHIHFMDWFAMRFVTPTDDCRDVDGRSSGCVVHEGVKISYCLHDLDPFDGDVMDFYAGQSALFLDPPVCDTTEQGVTQGWRDTYDKGLPGQVIIVGTPSEVADLGEVWLEAEVDPLRMIEESERHGNIARLLVEPPSNICGDSDKVLDCSMPPSEYDTTDQRRQCGDYVDFFD